MRHDYLHALLDALREGLRGGQVLILDYHGERSDFVRFTGARIRQAGHVRQDQLTLRLVDGRRQAAETISLTGHLDGDRARGRAALDALQPWLAELPDDPWLALPAPAASRHDGPAEMPDGRAALDALLRLGAGLDLVGVLASGEVLRACLDSRGTDHWFRTASFHLDWSLHEAGGRAVKAELAGERWDEAALAARLADQRRQMERLRLPVQTPGPGRYRAWLAPAALYELLELLAGGDLGIKALRTRQSALQALYDGQASLDPRVTLREALDSGRVPPFSSLGHHTPAPVTLIRAGRWQDPLVGPRSAVEYGLPVNAPQEAPQALEMAPGSLAEADVPAALDTGLYLTNLWYCNWSDRPHARITGMTRYACLWVERGVVRGPLAPMRFDDTLYRLLGEDLEAVGSDAVLLPDPSTYEARALRGLRLPGVLTGGLRLTL